MILRMTQRLSCSTSAAMTETGTLVISGAPGGFRNKKEPGQDASEQNLAEHEAAA